MKCNKLFLTVVLILLLCPWPAWGDEFRLVPSIGVKEQYNSNILLVPETQGVNKGFASIVSPGIEMVDNTDRLDTDLSAQVGRVDYSNHSDLSATNQAYKGSLAYRATPLLNISAQAGYTDDSNPTVDWGSGNGLQAGMFIAKPPQPQPQPQPPSSNPPNAGQANAGHAGLESSGASSPLPVVSTGVKRFTSSLSTGFALTEKTSAMMSYNYTNEAYEKPAYRAVSQGATAGLTYDFGSQLSRVKGRVNAGYSRYDLPDSRNDNATFTVGISRDFDEVWSVSLDGGIRRTWSEVFSLEPVYYSDTFDRIERVRHTNRGWGWVASVGLNYRGERTEEQLAYVRDLSLATGLSGAAERNSISLTTRYRLTYEFSALVTASYSWYKSDPASYSAMVIDQRTIDANAGIRYEFSKDTALDVSYGYTLVSYPAVVVNAHRQLAFIGLSAQLPFWE